MATEKSWVTEGQLSLGSADTRREIGGGCTRGVITGGRDVRGVIGGGRQYWGRGRCGGEYRHWKHHRLGHGNLQNDDNDDSDYDDSDVNVTL